MMDQWHDGGWGWAAWTGTGHMMLVFWTAVAIVVVVWLRTRQPDRPPAAASLHHDAERARDGG